MWSRRPIRARFFKIDHAASPMPETRQPERLARHQIGMVGEIISESWGEIKSVHPGEIIGIGSRDMKRQILGMCEAPRKIEYYSRMFNAQVRFNRSVGSCLTIWCGFSTDQTSKCRYRV